jgi:3-methyl-2-oxobutanoate hydroxymethyltransferase
MVMRHNRQTVVDIQSMKARGQKISMLYVTTLDEAAAAGVTILSIFSPEMREAGGRCFVQVGVSVTVHFTCDGVRPR